MAFRFLQGDPVDRVWVGYVGVGSAGVGLLSIPSSGPPLVVVPIFIGAAVATLVSSIRRSCPWGVVGLVLATLAGWIRAAALWGVDQNGAGASILATFVWLWIAGGTALLAVALAARGME